MCRDRNEILWAALLFVRCCRVISFSMCMQVVTDAMLSIFQPGSGAMPQIGSVTTMQRSGAV